MKLCVRCGQNDAKVWLEGVGRVHPKCMSEAETARHLKEQQQASNRIAYEKRLTAQGVSR